MKAVQLLATLAITSLAPVRGAEAPKTIFQETFEKAEVGKLPEKFKVYAGAFAVREAGGSKFMELPGSPLDSFGVLFGPPEKPPVAASARIFATKTGRKFPAFGLSVGGAGGYRLQISAAKGALELFRGDAVQKSVPFVWASGSWTRLYLQVRPHGSGVIVEGRAWADGSTEPTDWQISFESSEAAPTGMAGVWGNPFSGTPLRYDDLTVATLP